MTMTSLIIQFGIESRLGQMTYPHTERNEQIRHYRFDSYQRTTALVRFHSKLQKLRQRLGR